MPIEYHELWIEPTRRDLTGYYNDEWYFLDLNRYWNEHDLWKTGELFYGVHMLSKHQRLVAELLAEVVLPLIQRKFPK